MGDFKTNLKILRLLGDPTRYKIVKLLLSSKRNLCVNDIAFQMRVTPSAISHQFAKLELLHIVKPIRNGQNICYILTDTKEVKKIEKLMKLIEI